MTLNVVKDIVRGANGTANERTTHIEWFFCAQSAVEKKPTNDPFKDTTITLRVILPELNYLYPLWHFEHETPQLKIKLNNAMETINTFSRDKAIEKANNKRMGWAGIAVAVFIFIPLMFS